MNTGHLQQIITIYIINRGIYNGELFSRKIKGKEIKENDNIIIGGIIGKITNITKEGNDVWVHYENEGVPLCFNTEKDFYNSFFFRLVNKDETFKHIEKEKNSDDKVNHPSHYTQGKIECIDIIEEITKQCTSAFSGYLLGNVQKYIWRFMYKNGVEDLKKAEWYLHKLIKNEEKEVVYNDINKINE